MSLTSMYEVQTNFRKHGLQGSYELIFLLAKKSRSLTKRKELLKPAFAIYHQTMFDSETAGHQLVSLPLCYYTVRRRIDETAIDIQSQLNDILQNTKLLLALDKWIVRDNEALLLCYTRFKHYSKFEVLFSKFLKITTTARDIYAEVKEYFGVKWHSDFQSYFRRC